MSLLALLMFGGRSRGRGCWCTMRLRNQKYSFQKTVAYFCLFLILFAHISWVLKQSFQLRVSAEGRNEKGRRSSATLSNSVANLSIRSQIRRISTKAGLTCAVPVPGSRHKPTLGLALIRGWAVGLGSLVHHCRVVITVSH
jgi:hypothetical protein